MSELRVSRKANGENVRPIRQALRAFLHTLDVDDTKIDDIVTAAGEALANAIEHAYGPTQRGEVELHARAGPLRLTVDVSDTGRFVERSRRSGRGYGLRIVDAIADEVEIDHGSHGTRIRMGFALSRQSPSLHAVE